MVLVGEAHATRDDVVEFLALVVGQVDGRVLLFLEVRRRHQEGLGQLVLEMGGLVQVLEARAALDGQAFRGARQRIARQMRILAGQKLDDVDAQALRALVEERERQVVLPRFLRGVLGCRASRRVGHLLHGDVEVFAQGPNSPSHLFDVRLHARLTSFWYVVGIKVYLLYSKPLRFRGRRNHLETKKRPAGDDDPVVILNGAATLRSRRTPRGDSRKRPD